MADTEQTYEQFRKCIEDGDCDEAKQTASTYLGVDSELSQAVIDCAESRDSEACAKASAQIAAVAACDFATGAAGAYLCNKYAPQIVSAIWPVLGPPLTAMFDIGFGFIGATYEFFKGAVESFGKLIGIGSSPGTDWDAVVWHLKAAGRRAVGSASIKAVEAIGAADVSTRLEMGLPIEIDGGLSGPSLSKMLDTAAMRDVVAKRGYASQSALVHSLRSKPAFASEVRVAWPKRKVDGTMESITQWAKAPKPRLVSPTYLPTKDEIMLKLWGVDLSKWDAAKVSKMAKSGERASTTDIDFADFKLVDSSGEWPSSGKDIRDLQAAFGLAMSERVKALQSACSESVGSAVGSAIAERQQLDQEKGESGSGLLWLLGLAGAGALLYMYRDRVFK